MDLKNSILKVLQESLPNLDKVTSSAIKRTLLDTDVQSLLDNGYTIDNIYDLLKSKDNLSKEITKLNKKVKKVNFPLI